MHIVYTPLHACHDPTAAFVHGKQFESKELPARIEVIREALASAKLGPITNPIDYGREPILAVHDAGYIAYLETIYQRFAPHIDELPPAGKDVPVLANRTEVDPTRAARMPDALAEFIDYYTYDFEDPILADTWNAAYWSAQVALTAAGLVWRGAGAAYALCRPPGHHAIADRYGGFCYLNNAAIAARFLCGAGPVAVLDIDYHHGNGTQSIFYQDPRVLTVSLHADPTFDYPYYWGFAHERGAGPGTGTNLNLPLPQGTDDDVYLTALKEALDAIRRFAPAHLVVSMGLDAIKGDAIGKFNVTLDGWAEVGRRVAALALPTIIVQEGGYRLDQLGASALAFLSAFAGGGRAPPDAYAIETGV
ncbi:MAG: histone deacetylase family protein [Anaerolineae bacterium]